MWANLLAAGASVAGGLIGQKSQQKQAERNEANQREFAQNSIQWKTNDAQKAGIHPIYALGAPTTSYSPVSVGDSISPAMSNAGQDVSRAIQSATTAPAKQTAFTLAAQELALKKGALENELLASQVARARQTSIPSPPSINQSWGIPGQGETAVPASITEEAKRSSWDPRNPSNESHAIADVGYSRLPGGGYMPVPSQDVKQRIEDNTFQEVMHGVRNNLMPFLGQMNPPFPAPVGKKWNYNLTQGYFLVPSKGSRLEQFSPGSRLQR